MPEVTNNAAAPRRRWRYVWALPAAWAAISFAALHHPGDEYALWAVGSLAGLWVMPLVRDLNDVWLMLPFVLLAGAAKMAVVGLLLDLLRTPRRLWLLLWIGGAAAVLLVTLNAYPSYDRAIRKNGSLLAYVFFAANMGNYIASAAAILGMSAWRWYHPRPGPGHCPHCGYNKAGNISGTCPECGQSQSRSKNVRE